MSSSLSDRLLEIDNRLQQLAEEKELLLNERNSILAQQEVELAKHFNQHVSPEAKVDLFISYFKGRNDVYPFRWESQNGRSGYSPACWNEWKPKICNKPRISCTECSNQQFKHYDCQAVFDHLKGNQTIGIYPLLENNTTHILAADFDKDDWIHSVKAFSEACDFYKVPHIIERSRSGNGEKMLSNTLSTDDTAKAFHIGQLCAEIENARYFYFHQENEPKIVNTPFITQTSRRVFMPHYGTLAASCH